jgi:putative ABC transport system substrate-binding protein
MDRMTELAVDLVRMKVDVIFAPASPQVEAAKRATNTIPIVFGAHADSVGVGHVASLARPGGNITGSSNLLTELTAKGLEVLKEAIPETTRIGILWDPTAPVAHFATLESVEATAMKMGLQVHRAPVRSADEIDGALTTMAQAGLGAFVGVTSPLTYTSRAQLAEAALKYRLAGIFSARENVEVGALLSYGPNFDGLARRGDQSQDGKGAWPYYSTHTACPRRRGD